MFTEGFLLALQRGKLLCYRLGAANEDVSLIQALILLFYSEWVSPALWCRIPEGILENILCMGGIAKPTLIFPETSYPLLPDLWSHPRLKCDFVVTEHHRQESWEENYPCGGGMKCLSMFLGHAVFFWCCIHWATSFWGHGGTGVCSSQTESVP